jgi:ABC-2 type transport system ATP-binding protein
VSSPVPAEPPRRDGPAVAVQGLVKRYGGRAVLDRLSFRAARGAVTAVLGPNGAGKTTAIEICEGLRRADAGSVRILGLDPGRDAVRLRPRVGVMLQDGGMPTGARSRDVLTLVAAMHADPLPVDGLLTAVGLTEQARTTVRRLSGGQRQRLALAAALVGRPELVFLDEPTAGLDPQARQQVWGLVSRLRQGGTAVILTTHLLDEAERLADRVVLIDSGRVVAEGTPDELTGGDGDTLRFQGPPGLALDQLRGRLPAGVSLVEASPGGYLAAGSAGCALDAHIVAVVATWCAEQELTPRGMAVGRRTLEDVFLALARSGAAPPGTTSAGTTSAGTT